MVVLRIAIYCAAETVSAPFANFSLIDDPHLLRVERALVLYYPSNSVDLVEVDGGNWLIKNFQALHTLFDLAIDLTLLFVVVQPAQMVVGLLALDARNQDLIVCCKTFGTQNYILIKKAEKTTTVVVYFH